MFKEKFKQWVREAMNGPAQDMKADLQTKGPRTTRQDVIEHMSASMATIYRIDNGFLISMHTTSAAHMGTCGTLVYAKDAEELAQQIVANEARFKLGIAPAPAPNAGAFDVGVVKADLLKTYNGAFKYV